MRLLAIGALALSILAGACDNTRTATQDGSASPGPASAPGLASTPPLTAVHEITVPAGTHLTVSLDTPVGSDISRVEQPVTAHLTNPVNVGGETVIDAGSRVTGVVTDATRSGKVKGHAHVGVRFEALTPVGADQRYPIETTAVGRTAPATKKNDTLKIAGGAAGGALIGALIGGGKGAVIGGAAGGGAGTAVVLSTSGKEVHLPRGSALTLRLSQPVTIRIAG